MTGQGRSWLRRAFGTILEIAVFVALGPFVGTIVAGLVIVLSLIPKRGGLSLAAAAFAPWVMSKVLFSIYGGSWKAAGVTGFLMAISPVFMLGTRQFYVLAGLIGAMVSYLLGPFHWSELDATFLVAVGSAGAVAAMICTRLAVGLRLPELKELSK